MKPKFRLHIHIVGLPADAVHCYWTCSVRFPTPSTDVVLNSGPCTKPSSAIAEAALLMRRHH